MSTLGDYGASASVPTEREAPSLLARLEAAEVGSRELDCLVLEALTPDEADGSKWRALQWDANWFFALFGKDVAPAPNAWMVISQEQRVTTSLDAALSLAERVLPGMPCELFRNSPTEWGFHFADQDTCYAPTPPLAVCAAILRAKEPA